MARFRLPVLLLILLLPLLSLSAHASVAFTASLADLVNSSDVAALAVARSRTAQWEYGRIVTYSEVDIDTPLGGSLKGGERIVVRTLGGSIGDIGQVAIGEAALPLDAPFVVFLQGANLKMKTPRRTYHVTAMSQGLLPVVVGSDKVPRIGPSGTALELVPRDKAKVPSASESTTGRPVRDVMNDIQTLWVAREKK